MTSAIFIGLMFVLAALLIVGASISQRLAEKRKQRLRYLSVLTERARRLHALVTIFPPRFLGNDLNLWLNQTALDNTTQLIALEPNDPISQDDKNQYQARINELYHTNPELRPFILNSEKQISEFRMGLKTLNQLLISHYRSGKMSKAKLQAYHEETKERLAAISIEESLLLAREAQASNRRKVAQHYFDQARTLMSQEDDNNNYSLKIEELESELELLEQQLTEDAASPDSENETLGGLSDEWDEWDELDEYDNRKKKNF